jgi:hypothetical protein
MTPKQDAARVEGIEEAARLLDALGNLGGAHMIRRHLLGDRSMQAATPGEVRAWRAI